MMIYPKNPRSAIYAVAKLINELGPMDVATATRLMANGSFSERTIRCACWQLKREFMADEAGGVYTLRPHIVKFFADQVKAAAGQAAPIVAAPYRPNVFAGTLSKQHRPAARPIRPGADDYKSWPSVHAPFSKDAAQ